MGNTRLIWENYLRIIDQLPEKDREEVLLWLSQLLQAKQNLLSKEGVSLFGALNDGDSAEDWIKRIRSARTPGRTLESL